MSYSSPRDNWERLVTAVVKREQIWQLCHQNSISTIASDYTDVTLSFSSVRSVSSSSHQLPVINDSIIEDRKNASKTISQKLFSALRWKRKPKDCDVREGLVGIPEYDGLESFSLLELLIATDNFSYKNFIGRGAHGTVYKGRLNNGSVVVVKRLKQVIELQLEMASLVIHHNVIKLIGFCITQEEQLLVYPFMQIGCLESCLKRRQPALGWPVRNSIALGVAKGLAYLHEECVRTIIHRDVNAANILLDEDFQAVLADFCLAEFMDCHDDSTIKGTSGHMAPEYMLAGKFTEKADVFSYGIFLLQLITGQYSHELQHLATKDGMQLLEMVYTVYKEEKFEVLVDSSFEGNFVKEDVEKLFQLTLICIQDDPHERPTMSEVVRMIEDGECDERWKKFLWHKRFLTPGSVVLLSEGWMIFDSCSLTEAELLSDPR
ncbi:BRASSINOSTEROID INSENSITIVE 1-associated receptor kinase 1-like [Salvia splendens]|uniref:BRASSINOSTEROID INSENSITIVE 1-associated receptor kinase 1-like n=1 Tax=Salvia splendens TaxID=180675 RepID=UPI001C255D1F|nr:BRASSINOSTEROID INSENSITIVE 1-associated receptor kinase 1-like [Salvia splendens]XP_042029410.1 BRASSINOSTEROID INSENSITIVE 1-associated receptor kinase 1-like [Salvia splendens]XP_042029411.1 BRASSINOSTEROID INSENSITIVE 1-associated receptor kinase 1-like [Salvia splendens]